MDLNDIHMISSYVCRGEFHATSTDLYEKMLVWLFFDQALFIARNEIKYRYTQKCDQKKKNSDDTSDNAITKWRLEHSICHMNVKTHANIHIHM